MDIEDHDRPQYRRRTNYIRDDWTQILWDHWDVPFTTMKDHLIQFQILFDALPITRKMHRTLFEISNTQKVCIVVFYFVSALRSDTLIQIHWPNRLRKHSTYNQIVCNKYLSICFHRWNLAMPYLHWRWLLTFVNITYQFLICAVY